VFGVLSAPGGIELNAKGMALAYGIGALIFWAVVSYFSGAGALGAFAAFGTLIYCWLWIPNRTTNFLNDVPGVTTGMIEGSKQYTLNGVVPILGVISLVYGIQLIVLSVQRRRRARADAERLQREQEAAQAQQEADVAAVYPVAGSTYQEPAAYESRSSYDDLFDEPAPVPPRSQADEQTRQFPVAGEDVDQTRQFPASDAESNYSDDETVVSTGAGTAGAGAATGTAGAADVSGAGTADAPEAEEDQSTAADETQPVEQPQTDSGSTDVTQPVEQPRPQAKAESPDETPPVEQPQADSAPADEQPQTVQEDRPVEGKAPAGSPVSEPKRAERSIAPQEQMGTQYRERMEDPEDTGEFHLAFENPVIRPA
jgi:hypothetical protein